MKGAGVLRYMCVLLPQHFTAHCDTIHRKTLVLACEMNKYICTLCSRVSLTHTLGHTKRNIYPFLGRTSNVFSIE